MSFTSSVTLRLVTPYVALPLVDCTRAPDVRAHSFHNPRIADIEDHLTAWGARSRTSLRFSISSTLAGSILSHSRRRSTQRHPVGSWPVSAILTKRYDVPYNYARASVWNGSRGSS